MIAARFEEHIRDDLLSMADDYITNNLDFKDITTDQFYSICKEVRDAFILDFEKKYVPINIHSFRFIHRQTPIIVKDALKNRGIKVRNPLWKLKIDEFRND